MRQDITSKLTLALLHDIDVSEHAVGLEALGELVTDRRGTVKTRERDELEDESRMLLACNFPRSIDSS